MATLCEKVLGLVSLPESERWTEDGRSDARLAVTYTLEMWEALYRDLGRDDATLFTYALFGTLGRSREPDDQRRANGQLSLLESAFPELADEDRAGAIIRHHRSPLYDNPNGVSAERYALIANAHSGLILRGVQRTYTAFMRAPSNMFST